MCFFIIIVKPIAFFIYYVLVAIDDVIAKAL